MLTLSRHSDGVSYTSALKRKHEADSAKNVNVIEVEQLQCEEEMKGL